MKSKFAKRLAAMLLTLVMSLGLLVPGAFAAGTVNDVKEKTGKDGQIVVTVYNQAPVTGDNGTGTGAQVSTLTSPVNGVGINALRIGSVVELTSTAADGTVSTQVAFGLSSDICSLLGLTTGEAIASDAGTHYFAPKVVQDALTKVDQDDIEDYLNDTNNGATNKVTGEGSDEDGVATFENLTYGLYLLAKSKLPADATTDLVPFLVSVPMYVESGAPNTAGTWNKEVYAYPKVRADDITLTKAAGDPGADGYVSSGDTIPFTISVTIPASQAAEPGTGAATKFTQFTITDTNAGGTLDIDEASVEVELGGESLEGKFDQMYNGGVLTITLTDTADIGGLAELNKELNTQQTLTITYNATVATNVTDFSYELTNTAALSYQREGMASLDDTKKATVTLYTYGIDLTKTLSDKEDTIDANEITFELYKTYTGGNLSNRVPVQKVGNNYWVAAEAGASGTNTYAMDVNEGGKLTLYGLEPGTYYLKETATMDGYALLDEPIKIEIDKDQSKDIKATATINGATATDDPAGVFKLSVENTKLTAGFALPQTGGAGTLAVTAIGLGLLCVAIVLLVVYRKKGNKNS